MARNDFKAGDRVTVYGYSLGGAYHVGDVGTIATPISINVKDDEFCVLFETGARQYFHRRQLCRLKPKKRREWWCLVDKKTGEAGSMCKSLEQLTELCAPTGIPSSCNIVFVREVFHAQKVARPPTS